MFGYVNAYNPELKMKDFYKYKAYYCGLCRTLQQKYGFLGQITLTYDMTFLIVLLTSLYETETVKDQRRCIVHPVKKHDQLTNEITEYAADMNIALSYHHFKDDWQDEKSILGAAGSLAFKKAYLKIEKQYPRQCQIIEESLKQLHTYEENNEENLDIVAGTFGTLMAGLIVYRQDQWEESLKKLGFFLGKFIYLMDAYEDLQEDLKKACYNPLKRAYEKPSYEETCKTMLTMMMADCTIAFEKLPCIQDIDILRNILYVGVWNKYDTIQKKNLEQEGITKDDRSL